MKVLQRCCYVKFGQVFYGSVDVLDEVVSSDVPPPVAPPPNDPDDNDDSENDHWFYCNGCGWIDLGKVTPCNAVNAFDAMVKRCTRMVPLDY